MDTRKMACVCAASFLGLGITVAGTGVHAKPRSGDVTVTATDPTLQRRVSYADLNLAVKPDQRVLRRRISYTASNLCLDINGWDDGSCRSFAIDSTRDQVKLAIARAEQQMAGRAVGPPIAISMVILTNP
jgi:UrcA family protein